MFQTEYRKTYNFTKFKTIRTFGNDIDNEVMTMEMENGEQK